MAREAHTTTYRWGQPTKDLLTRLADHFGDPIRGPLPDTQVLRLALIRLAESQGVPTGGLTPRGTVEKKSQKKSATAIDR